MLSIRRESDGKESYEGGLPGPRAILQPLTLRFAVHRMWHRTIVLRSDTMKLEKRRNKS